MVTVTGPYFGYYYMPTDVRLSQNVSKLEYQNDRTATFAQKYSNKNQSIISF